jgi:hypothetical protein
MTRRDPPAGGHDENPGGAIMRAPRTRRTFLADVGRGMVVAAVGSTLATDLGLAVGAVGDERLTFGPLEPLVTFMQETTPERLIPELVERLRAGAELKSLVAAAALANARTFGGEDYVGFHTMMALAPAYHMAVELPEAHRALPVLKVLHRNTRRIQEASSGSPAEVLHPVDPMALADSGQPGPLMREAVRSKDMGRADATFAALADTPEAAFNAVLWAVQDNTEVHRTVLPYRAWDLLGIIGPEHARTLLRQSVHYCVKSERDWNHTPEIDRPRRVLPAMLDQYKLVGRAPGDRPPDDAWVERTSRALFEATPEGAAEIAAAALAEGITPDAIGEAISLAANQLVLRDAGRSPREAQAIKPAGSVHGDSIGVHACDSANAWRHMARVSDTRNAYACLILGAFQVASDRVNRGGDFLNWTPRPHPDALEAVRESSPDKLIGALHDAVRHNDQERACAVAQRLGEAGAPARDVFDALLGYAVSEDGALHAEKYYRTASEEFAGTRPAFRWRQLVSLARVTASAYGYRAPGYDDACERLAIRPS